MGFTHQDHSTDAMEAIKKMFTPEFRNRLDGIIQFNALHRNVILVMTTNAGAEALNRNAIGFAAPAKTGDEMSEIKRMFTPEFRNRLDAIIGFTPLSRDIILRVVDKFLMQLEDQLHEKRVDVTFAPELREHLAKEGFDPSMGARPMQRLIQDTVRRALADELLFGRLVDGGHVEVGLDEQGKVTLTFPENGKGSGTGRDPSPSRPEPELVD